MCINNSTGEQCELCDEWYWGDAVDAKDCQGKSACFLSKIVLVKFCLVE